MKQQQQGDVLLQYVKTLPSGAKAMTKNGSQWIIMHGEGGHIHAVRDIEHSTLYEVDGQKYLQIHEPVELSHETHRMQVLEPGIIEIGVVQEFDYLTGMSAPVVD